MPTLLNVTNEFSGRTVMSGKKDIWTNSKLFCKEETLWSLIEKNKTTIWLITTSEASHYRSSISKIAQKYFKYLFYTSIDEKINVYKINSRRT